WSISSGGRGQCGTENARELPDASAPPLSWTSIHDFLVRAANFAVIACRTSRDCVPDERGGPQHPLGRQPHGKYNAATIRAAAIAATGQEFQNILKIFPEQAESPGTSGTQSACRRYAARGPRSPACARPRERGRP